MKKQRPGKKTKHQRPANAADHVSPESKPIPKSDAPHAEKARDQGAREKEPSKLDIAMVRWTRIVGLFTAVLSIVGCIQAWAFIQSERAGLLVEYFQFQSGLIVGKQLTMGYKIRNSGKSTAEITDISLNVKAELVYPLPYIPVSELAPIQIGAGSSEDFTYYALTDGKPYILNPATADAINTGSLKFFIYGFVDYNDDFWIAGAKRSYFCFRYDPERSTQTVSAFRGCPIAQHQK